jgi:hypothetical protein
VDVPKAAVGDQWETNTAVAVLCFLTVHSYCPTVRYGTVRFIHLSLTAHPFCPHNRVCTDAQQ